MPTRPCQEEQSPEDSGARWPVQPTSPGDALGTGGRRRKSGSSTGSRESHLVAHARGTAVWRGWLGKAAPGFPRPVPLRPTVERVQPRPQPGQRSRGPEPPPPVGAQALGVHGSAVARAPVGPQSVCLLVSELTSELTRERSSLGHNPGSPRAAARSRLRRAASPGPCPRPRLPGSVLVTWFVYPSHTRGGTARGSRSLRLRLHPPDLSFEEDALSGPLKDPP